MAGRVRTKKNGLNGNGNGNGAHAVEDRNRLHAWIVGPDAPEGQDERMDPATKARAQEFDSMRKAVVQIGKRMGTYKQESGKLRIKTGKRKKGKKGRRTRTRKVDTDIPREAPTTTGDDDDQEAFGRTDVTNDFIIPPFDFVTLCTLFENSGALRQNIDAMVTNVDGFGHQFLPVLDWSDPNINNVIRDMLMRANVEEGDAPDDLMKLTDEQLESATPGIEEVEATKKRWQQISAIELGRAECFFEFVNPLEPFTEVRQAMRESLELMGNAAWEVLRENPMDVNSKISQIYNVPFVNVRLIRADREPVEVEMVVRKDAVHFDTVKVKRYFRRYVRTLVNRKIFYKEFGDPRVISRDSGARYKDLDALKAEEGKAAQPGNEMFHWKIRSPISAYGVPRWIGTLLSVLGSRAAEEVNFLFFDNKAIPPMVLMVSGGRVSEQAVERLESYFDDKVKGRENFHKIMIIEGVPADADVSEGDLEHSGKLRMELRPLMNEIQQDALFQDYDANNIKKVGRAFRQPPIMTGDTKDMNRSTAEVAKAMAEEQVYQPARDAFDAAMDRHVMTNLVIHFWRFKTNAPVQRIPSELVTNAKKALDGGAITANEARKLFADAFSIKLPFRDEDWANAPPKLVLQAARQGAMASAEPTDGAPSLEGAVENSTGDVIARGKTTRDGPDDHDHSYSVVREGSSLKITISTDGEAPHTHEVDTSEVAEGQEVEITTSEVNDHTHTITFTAPLTKRTRRLNGFAALVAALRGAVQSEIEAAKDEFFDPSNWADDADQD